LDGGGGAVGYGQGGCEMLYPDCSVRT
jgi:hypothetical protein